MQPASGEGGQLELRASTANTTQAGIVLDQLNSQFRIFGRASADGTTKTGTGTPLVIDPYAKTITGGYTLTGSLSGNATSATTAADSSKLNGYVSDTAKTANTIVRRDANGYIYAAYYNQSSSAETPTTSSYLIYANSDGWFRKSTLANVKTILGLGSAAYTASTAYATASHNHDSAYVNVSGDTMTGALYINMNANKPYFR